MGRGQVKSRTDISRHDRWYDASLAKLREESERGGDGIEYQVRKRRNGFVVVKRVSDGT